jgi:hypothetical protein
MPLLDAIKTRPAATVGLASNPGGGAPATVDGGAVKVQAGVREATLVGVMARSPYAAFD